MYCEKCKKYTAVFHVNDFSTGRSRELHLCNYCAFETGLEKKMENNAMYKKAVFTVNITEEVNYAKKINERFCLNCGLTERDLFVLKKPGCPSCYKYFKEYFLVGTESSRKYSGKVPVNYIEVMAMNRNSEKYSELQVNPLEKENLVRELNEAVLDERYEEAAVLRDKIKELNLSLME